MNNYDEMTQEALYELAQERDIDGRSAMNKDELIAAHVHYDRTRASAPAETPAQDEAPQQTPPQPQPQQGPEQPQPVDPPPLQETPPSDSPGPNDPYGGSVVSVDDYERVVEENRQLKAEVERLNRQLNPQ